MDFSISLLRATSLQVKLCSPPLAITLEALRSIICLTLKLVKEMIIVRGSDLGDWMSMIQKKDVGSILALSSRRTVRKS